MSPATWTKELAWIEAAGFGLDIGLSEHEIHAAERVHGFRFPPDLRNLLSTALPVGKGFPNWRDPNSSAIADQLAWPAEGILFDVEHNAFWLSAWGERPAELSVAQERATACLQNVPRLIPLYSHRYLPAEPAESGNPVLSVYQTDIICYGSDLAAYAALEFGGLSYEEAADGKLKNLPFWGDLIS